MENHSPEFLNPENLQKIPTGNLPEISEVDANLSDSEEMVDIISLKINKESGINGIPAEMIKYEGNKYRKIYDFILEISEKGQMLN